MNFFEQIIWYMLSTILLLYCSYERCDGTNADELKQNISEIAKAKLELDELILSDSLKNVDNSTKNLILRVLYKAHWECVKEQIEKQCILREKHCILRERDLFEFRLKGASRFARFLACGASIRFIVETMAMSCLTNVDAAKNRQLIVNKELKKLWTQKEERLTNVIKFFGSYTAHHESDLNKEKFNGNMARLRSIEINFDNSPSPPWVENASLRKSLEVLRDASNDDVAFNYWMSDIDTLWMMYANLENLPETTKQIVRNITRIFSQNYIRNTGFFLTNEYDYACDVTEHGCVLIESNPEQRYLQCLWYMYTEVERDDRIRKTFDDVERDWKPRLKKRSKVIHHYCDMQTMLYIHLSNYERHKTSAFSPDDTCQQGSEDYKVFLIYLGLNSSDMAYVAKSLMNFNVVTIEPAR